uniref:Uncharacterized protein n=1 Tax=Pipistrellus kuhlii TaxID=59472 RepID=A0A7J8A961_PIPKU|nr:hypothetical protein mPipKuh1_008864 [Pipistrellus kuhlii]
MTRTNQGCRHGVARETRHALFATNPSTMTVTNQRQGMLRFLKGTTNGLRRFVEGRGLARASVPEEDLSSNRKYREGGRSGKDQVFFTSVVCWSGSSSYSTASASSDPDDHRHQGGCVASEKRVWNVGFAFEIIKY